MGTWNMMEMKVNGRGINSLWPSELEDTSLIGSEGLHGDVEHDGDEGKWEGDLNLHCGLREHGEIIFPDQEDEGLHGDVEHDGDEGKWDGD